MNKMKLVGLIAVALTAISPACLAQEFVYTSQSRTTRSTSRDQFTGDTIVTERNAQGFEDVDFSLVGGASQTSMFRESSFVASGEQSGFQGNTLASTGVNIVRVLFDLQETDLPLRYEFDFLGFTQFGGLDFSGPSFEYSRSLDGFNRVVINEVGIIEPGTYDFQFDAGSSVEGGTFDIQFRVSPVPEPSATPFLMMALAFFQRRRRVSC